MNFCFIIPPQPTLHKPSAYVSLGVGYLAAVLERKGHAVQVHDMNIESGTFPEADMYGITCVSATFQAAHDIARTLTNGGKTVIVGGVHPSIAPEGFSDLNCHVVTGEAENIIAGLIEQTAIPKVTHAGLTQDLDSLPLPARHLFKNVVDYSGIHGQPVWTGATTLLSSRGCPYACNFCTRIPQTKKPRLHSPEYMLREIQSVIDEYQVNHFRFVDDLFTFDAGRISTFCDQARKLDIHWMCITRGDVLYTGLLEKMRSAGCYEIDIGVESGSPKVLEMMNKRISVDILAGAIGLIKDAGIKVKVYLMYGFPGETDQDRELTLRFVTETKPDAVTMSKFAPIPGSKMWKNGQVGSEQWFYQDTDRAYQEFRRKVNEAGGTIKQ